MFAKSKPRTPLATTQLRQTKLCVSQDNRLTFERFSEPPKPNIEFVYVPSERPVSPPSKTPRIEPKSAEDPPESPMNKPGRDLVSLMGRVDFCLKTHKKYPHLNAIWSVFGKLIRTIKGKRGELTLLVRNENAGPILQGIFYDFEEDSRDWNPGCYVQLVGRFTGPNRLKTFTVSEVSYLAEQLLRIENVTNHVLMQSNVHK